ncbi:hypothetical protein OAN307_c47600 [Octadecabacter antarcticus 307]|uniref:Uncharacterized protein n=1 Tax=Octadecabacter antarcticus 307 TaxID=391626 RepID=M9RI82_9RHOB|nr:hypothetical protein [Octadecabacter antarcticus]AGI70106.1 hypothetical protein OAN307_c47600 [Octadecabacter antarcticus 307]
MVVKKELKVVASGETSVAVSGDASSINQEDDQMLIKRDRQVAGYFPSGYAFV